MTILDLAQLTGVNPKWVAGTGGGEYHSACPACGGTDRFFIQPFRQMHKCLGSYCCRQCGIRGDAIQFARQFLNYSFEEAAQTVNAVIDNHFRLPLLRPKQSFKPTILKRPNHEWVKRATEFVEIAHAVLLQKNEILKLLSARGLPIDAVCKYKIGYIEKDMFFSREHWGLESQTDCNGNSRLLWMPKGIIIPAVESDGSVIRLKVRRSDWHKKDKLAKYIAVTGSMNGLSLIGNNTLPVMLVVESELDAYATHYAAPDRVFVVAIGGSSKSPDNVTDCHARHKKLLICHDNDAAGEKMLNKWQTLYPHGQAFNVPVGKDIGEAIENGFDIKKWIVGEVNNGTRNT